MVKEKSEQVIARVTPATQEELRRIALEMERSVSWIVNNLIVKFIADHASNCKKQDDGPKKRTLLKIPPADKRGG